MTAGAEAIHIWGVVPAAGMSRRMGAAKQTLPIGGSTMVAAVTQTLLAADLDAVVVVTRTDLAEALRLPDDPRLGLCFNDDPQSQMLDSIRIGLDHIAASSPAATGPQDGVLVVPADMPTVSVEALRVCMNAYRTSHHRIVIATHGGRHGHPMIFPLVFRAELDDLAAGLNELARRHADRVTEISVRDPGVLRDVDTHDDYTGLEP